MTGTQKILNLEAFKQGTWGTYGKFGDKEFKRIKIGELSTEHIINILIKCKIGGIYQILFIELLNERMQGKIIDKIKYVQENPNTVKT